MLIDIAIAEEIQESKDWIENPILYGCNTSALKNKQNANTTQKEQTWNVISACEGRGHRKDWEVTRKTNMIANF